VMPEMLRWLWRDMPRTVDPADEAGRQPLPAAAPPSDAAK